MSDSLTESHPQWTLNCCVGTASEEASEPHPGLYYGISLLQECLSDGSTSTHHQSSNQTYLELLFGIKLRISIIYWIKVIKLINSAQNKKIHKNYCNHRHVTTNITLVHENENDKSVCLQLFIWYFIWRKPIYLLHPPACMHARQINLLANCCF